jgi:gluconate 2-dehydrogenase gamma chain
MSPRIISRRDLLRTGLAAAAAAVPADALALSAGARSDSPTSASAIAAAEAQTPDSFQTLNAAEAATLQAITARLIPTDANGPGAAEAHAARYIDRALGGALHSSRPAYSAGLAAIDEHARSSKGSPFAQLSPANQDAVLADVEHNVATGFASNSAAFFNLLRGHTIQGTFSDPFYGGNADFIGWDLLGYPGVRTIVPPDQQRLGIDPAPNHKSAYDYEMFLKATAENRPPHEPEQDTAGGD